MNAIATDLSYESPFKRSSADQPLLGRVAAIAKTLDGANGVEGASFGDMRADLAELRRSLQGALGVRYPLHEPHVARA